MSTRTRLAFIDLLRGWALVVMIEVHVFNTFILPSIKSTPWFEGLTFINGLVAPSFTFISGFVFILASQKKLESFREYGSVFWKQVGRIGLIWIVGYYLHLPFFSYHKTTTETTEAGWLRFYQSDVLHCIAFGLLILFLLRLAIKNDRIYRRVLFLSGMGIVLTTLFIWDIDFLQIFPAPLAAYMNSKHYSLFPIFPWIGFMLFGGYFAAGYSEARVQAKERDYILRLVFIGSIIAVLCGAMRVWSVNLSVGSSDIRANPFFFFERLGFVMLLLTVCWFYAERRRTEKTFILDVSRESLMVYAAHLLVIHGEFWDEKSLASYYGKTFGVWECLGATIGLILVMIVVAIVWGQLKRRHLMFTRFLFWSFAVMTTLWFFVH